MINAELEKRLYNDFQSIYWLKLKDTAEPEDFQLPAAIESNVLLTKVVKAHAPKLAIDLSTVKEFDSCGMQMLVMLYKQFSEQKLSIVLQNPAPYVSRMLNIMQLDRWFEIETELFA